MRRRSKSGGGPLLESGQREKPYRELSQKKSRFGHQLVTQREIFPARVLRAIRRRECAPVVDEVQDLWLPTGLVAADPSWWT